MLPRKLSMIFWVAAAFTMPTTTARAEDKIVALDGDAKLKVVVPDHFTATVDGGDQARTVTLETPADDKDKHVSLVMTVVPVEAGKKLSDDDLKKAATEAAAQYADGSVEKKTTLVEIKGDATHGWLATFTDAAADPGDFKYVTTGAVLVGDHLVAVTLFSNNKDGDGQKAAMDALKKLAIENAKADH